jgi:hypothetical protein
MGRYRSIFYPIRYYNNEAKTTCAPCILNCLKCSAKNFCDVCSNGYYYNGVTCAACGIACERCIGAGICIKCTYG